MVVISAVQCYLASSDILAHVAAAQRLGRLAQSIYHFAGLAATSAVSWREEDGSHPGPL